MAVALGGVLAAFGLDSAPTPLPVAATAVEMIPYGAPCDANGDGVACGRVRLNPGTTIAVRDEVGRYICDNDDRIPVAELCDGIDNDCDTQTDEGYNLGQPCWEGYGPCQRDGVWVCSTDARIALCSVGSLESAALPEVCGNGVDEDCDGADLPCSPAEAIDGGPGAP